ncbi:hypothetical protein [Agreia sp. Leaf283]|uniref:hypothetical protein n=1 Tax=Agreia sp. Leaf283 TaxID=1736321 RepID=UPI0006FF4E09|nr:hypothetical protein [Agreia sp. Leaf283]KQP53930.1 hypothetical protein ASF51_17525 [Agreia sp. Leaf283]
MSETVQMLIAGIVGFAAGVLLIVFRKPIARFFAEQLMGFGLMGISTARRSTPDRTALTGAVAVFIGSVLVMVAVARLTGLQSWT